MAYKRCDKCGYLINLDEGPERCKACGAKLDGSEAEQPASTSFASLADDAPPLTTGGQVESYGAYGRAADESWVDPAEQVRKQEEEVTLDVPEEILLRHKAQVARRNNLVGIGLAVLAILILVSYFLSR